MNFERRNLARRTGRPFCNCGATALLLALLLLGVANLARGSASNSPRTLPPGTAAAFAIADFDGDQQPDFATVQTGRSSLHESFYWISFELSSGSRQTIGLTAPAGGLKLDSRDVNGDHMADLIVSTIWLGRPVAILLNDGNGNFTVVDPHRFPAATQPSQEGWSLSSMQINDVSVAPPSRPFPKVLRMRSTGFVAGNGQPLAATFPARVRALRPAMTRSGRAPPTAVLHV
jgi:hypothetical protein